MHNMRSRYWGLHCVIPSSELRSEWTINDKIKETIKPLISVYFEVRLEPKCLLRVCVGEDSAVGMLAPHIHEIGVFLNSSVCQGHACALCLLVLPCDSNNVTLPQFLLTIRGRPQSLCSWLHGCWQAEYHWKRLLLADSGDFLLQNGKHLWKICASKRRSFPTQSRPFAVSVAKDPLLLAAFKNSLLFSSISVHLTTVSTCYPLVQSCFIFSDSPVPRFLTSPLHAYCQACTGIPSTAVPTLFIQNTLPSSGRRLHPILWVQNARFDSRFRHSGYFVWHTAKLHLSGSDSNIGHGYRAYHTSKVT